MAVHRTLTSRLHHLAMVLHDAHNIEAGGQRGL